MIAHKSFKYLKNTSLQSIRLKLKIFVFFIRTTLNVYVHLFCMYIFYIYSKCIWRHIYSIRSIEKLYLPQYLKWSHPPLYTYRVEVLVATMRNDESLCQSLSYALVCALKNCGAISQYSCIYSDSPSYTCAIYVYNSDIRDTNVFGIVKTNMCCAGRPV